MFSYKFYIHSHFPGGYSCIKLVQRDFLYGDFFEWPMQWRQVSSRLELFYATKNISNIFHAVFHIHITFIIY